MLCAEGRIELTQAPAACSQLLQLTIPGGLRIAIFKDDRAPAHVHVQGNGEAEVHLIGLRGEPVLVWTADLSRGDLRRALRIIRGRRREFLARRRTIDDVDISDAEWGAADERGRVERTT